MARGENRPESDIDILARYSEVPGLLEHLEHISLAQTLEDMLRKKVDLVTESSLREFTVPNVKKDL